jgi:hypothetical protein
VLIKICCVCVCVDLAICIGFGLTWNRAVQVVSQSETSSQTASHSQQRVKKSPKCKLTTKAVQAPHVTHHMRQSAHQLDPVQLTTKRSQHTVAPSTLA